MISLRVQLRRLRINTEAGDKWQAYRADTPIAEGEVSARQHARRQSLNKTDTGPTNK